MSNVEVAAGLASLLRFDILHSTFDIPNAGRHGSCSNHRPGNNTQLLRLFLKQRSLSPIFIDPLFPPISHSLTKHQTLLAMHTR
jgi:hypothetical protein